MLYCIPNISSILSISRRLCSSIPVQAEYLPAKGLEQLLQTVNKVKRQINPKLQIDGILLTMVDNRTNFAKEIAALLRETYGSKIKVFGTEIPHSVRAKEISAEGKNIFAHDPGGKVLASKDRYFLITKDPITMKSILVDDGFDPGEVKTVIIGPCNDRPGATKLGNNQAITQPEADALEAIMQKGYEVEFALIKEAAIGNWKKFRGQFGY